MLIVTSRISIPLEELEFSYSRSAGPGGQNVNKVSSKVTLHWNVTESPSLPEEIRQRFLARYQTRLNKQGQLVMSSQRFREQRRNVSDCVDRLRQMILDVVAPPKRRKPTRPTLGSKERRLRQKQQTAQKKQGRQDPGRDS